MESVSWKEFVRVLVDAVKLPIGDFDNLKQLLATPVGDSVAHSSGTHVIQRDIHPL